MSSPILKVVKLQTSFGLNEDTQFAVDDVSFSINKGETFALLGESGSGKSITALSIMRLLPAAARINQGSIFLDDKDLLTLPEYAMRDIRGSRIAMIFQEPQTSLNPVLTVGQQIGETLQRHKNMRGVEQRRRCIELLESVGIPESERRIGEYPHQFSGGMKQRIMIAIALAGEPDLLIADEPTTALDVTIQAQVLDLLRQIQNDTGMAMLFITHDLAVASEMADDVAVMRYGKIVEQNSRDSFYANPAHPYSQELFAALPSRTKRDAETESVQTRTENYDTHVLLKVRDLKVHFPIKKGILKKTVGFVRAVDGVSIDIYSGQTFAMVGESGSGKTTFGKGILQLLHASDGSVVFDGQELTQLKGRALRQQRSDIQIVFQDPYSSMNPRMMIADVIAEGMVAQGIGGSKQQRLKRVDDLLEQVGLEPAHKNRYPHEFSGGQRQRICIARALAVEPKLIVCDEPTSALDVSVQSQILELLKNLQKNMGLGYLFITHNISVVEYLAHYVAVMYQGKIVEQGTVDEVLTNPQDPYTQKLLAAVPRLKTGT
ncbi:MAG: ABC transporter ATP-binding protein [Gammaproteobacteria bacterium]